MEFSDVCVGLSGGDLGRVQLGGRGPRRAVSLWIKPTLVHV